MLFLKILDGLGLLVLIFLIYLLVILSAEE